MLRERQKSILDYIIRTHIQSGRPVASRDIAAQSVFDVSPATIRSEMQELDERGYLEQPHTSAGRVPTDKGYRFFVDHLAEEEMLDARERGVLDGLLRLRDEERFIRDFARTVARITRGLTAVRIPDDGMFCTSGFSEMLKELEFEGAEEIKTMGRLIDSLDEKAGSIFDESDGDRMFIGRENPWKEAKCYTMVQVSWRHPAGFKGFFAALGPRRMDYEKMVSLMQYLKENV